MSTNLRDRRRRETSREIQLAALNVALRTGYGAATTEAIAAEAGISPRTFFNYYCNKQAAILGQPPVLDVEAGRWIVTSDGPLVDDISRLLGEMLCEERPDRGILKRIIQVVDQTPELLAVFRKSMDEMTLALSGLLEARLGREMAFEARLLAELGTHALSNAVRAWAEGTICSEDDIRAMTRDQLERVAKLLC
ncbi:MAG: TetR family transcriptional regulator [Paracoccus sp. (in: a-proteobacteria)]|uniref:TetR family transcriptional regulator n=1 Tax=Paracoccus sp. TaxID=267 RepID=UPI002E8A49A0|nr:TetR family transcriptional regulator [Pseudomonadota bacterium]